LEDKEREGEGEKVGGEVEEERGRIQELYYFAEN
jgi:hypothetical protein